MSSGYSGSQTSIKDVILMSAAPRVIADAVRPASAQVVPTVAATLRPIHSRWMTETSRWLAATLRRDADYWTGWSAVRYLNERFDRLFRWQRILVSAIMPQLPPADARVLRATTDALEEVRYDLDRVGRWRNMTAVTGGLTYRFLKLLNAWFVEIERVTQSLTDAELSPAGRRALAQLESTSSKVRGGRE
jgi:hypothetical protein